VGFRLIAFPRFFSSCLNFCSRCMISSFLLGFIGLVVFKHGVFNLWPLSFHYALACGVLVVMLVLMVAYVSSLCEICVDS